MRARRRWTPGVAVAAVACVVLAGCQSVTRLTTNTRPNPSACFGQSISGDGRWVAFSTIGDPNDPSSDQKTVLRDRRTGTSRELAGNPSYAPLGTAVDADGSEVVMMIGVHTSSPEPEYRAFAWHRATGKRTQVSSTGESVRDVAISGDGKKVAYVVGSGGIVLYDQVTKTRKQVVTPPGEETFIDNVSLSTTGRILGWEDAFATGSPAYPFVRDNQTGTEWPLFSGAQEWSRARGTVALSGDGRWAVFTKGRSDQFSGTDQVYLWDRTTHTSRRLTGFGPGVTVGNPTISRDGSTIAYLQTRHGETHNSLVTVDRAGGKTTVALTGNRFLHEPTISADGHTIVVCTDSTNLVPKSPAAPNLYVLKR